MSKEEIIKHAIECFAKDGYEGTSISTILKKANATKGQLYHHFSSKDELFIQAAFDCHKKSNLHKEDNNITSIKSKTEYKKVFLDFGKKFIQMYKKRPYLAQMNLEVTRICARNPKIMAKLLKKMNEKKPKIVQSIQHGIDIGAFNKKYDLDYIMFRIKSTLDTIILHNAMKTCLFDYDKMWEKTIEDLFQ